MSEVITSAFSETTEKISSVFGDTYKLVFIGLVILLFLAINNIIIYLLYMKLRRIINNYCDNREKNPNFKVANT